MKFTPRGGTVTARLTTSDARAAVVVEERASGFARSRCRTCSRFWQAESVHGRETGGLGLGLALARHFVELHGGTSSAHSDGENRGSIART